MFCYKIVSQIIFKYIYIYFFFRQNSPGERKHSNTKASSYSLKLNSEFRVCVCLRDEMRKEGILLRILKRIAHYIYRIYRKYRISYISYISYIVYIVACNDMNTSDATQGNILHISCTINTKSVGLQKEALDCKPIPSRLQWYEHKWHNSRQHTSRNIHHISLKSIQGRKGGGVYEAFQHLALCANTLRSLSLTSLVGEWMISWITM